MSTSYDAFREQFTKVIREFTEDLKKIADEVNKPKALEPGQAIDADTARGLPVGSSFRDAQSDVWYVTDQGFSWYASGRDTTDLDPARYEPLTLVSLPEPPADLDDEDDEDDEDEDTDYELADWEKELLGAKPYHVQVGDLVRITAGINSFQGQVGTVGKLTSIKTGLAARHSNTGAIYTVEGSGFYAGDVEKVVDPEPEPAPVAAGRPEVAIGDYVRTIRANLPYRVAQAEGLEGEVTGVFRNADGSIRYVSVQGWGIKEYEVIPTPAEPEPTKYVPEPGSRVKVIRTKYAITAYRQGEEGTVEGTEEGVPWVRFDDGGKVLAAETEPVPAPEPEADPVTDPLKITDRDGDVLEVNYIGYNSVVKVHTNQGGQRNFSSVYLTASDLDDVIARLQEFKKAYEASGDRFPF